MKVALCTRARTSNELKISIEAARLACPETKDETHFLPLPLFVPIAEFDPADQRVRSGMSVRTEMLCDGKTRRILVDASEVFEICVRLGKSVSNPLLYAVLLIKHVSSFYKLVCAEKKSSFFAEKFSMP